MRASVRIFLDADSQGQFRRRVSTSVPCAVPPWMRAALATYLLMDESAVWRLDQRLGAVNVIELVEGVPLVRLLNG